MISLGDKVRYICLHKTCFGGLDNFDTKIDYVQLDYGDKIRGRLAWQKVDKPQIPAVPIVWTVLSTCQAHDTNTSQVHSRDTNSTKEAECKKRPYHVISLAGGKYKLKL